MKHSKMILSGMGLALSLLLASPVVAAPGRDWAQWLSHYYENPQPELVVKAVYGLSRAGYFEEAAQPATAIGFLAAVFAENPEKMAEWSRAFRDLPQAHQRLVAAAMWYSGVPAGAEQLRAKARHSDPAVRVEMDRLIAMGGPALRDTPVLSESSMNLQWGAFVATGNPQHILNVLTALGSDEPALNSAARLALAEKAALHTKVYAICEAQLSQQPDKVKNQLSAALVDAKSRP